MSEQTVNVKLDKHQRPGLKACGPYRPGKAYDVDLGTALHLVDVKGFEPTTTEGAEQLENARRKRAETGQDGEAAAAPGPEPVTDPYADFLGGSVRQIRRDLEAFTADELEHLAALEQAGQDREGVHKAISERLQALREES